MTSSTRTGGFPIGFRRGFGQWQREDLDAVIAFALARGFSCLDLERDGDRSGKSVLDAGLRLGSVDLPEWADVMSSDGGRRADAVARNAAYIRECASLGPLNHFVVLGGPPEEESVGGRFALCVRSLSELAPVLADARARIVIEGCPGPTVAVCTPETFRELFRRVGDAPIGINYDPSHLIRMGIDPLRFLREFAGRVYHVHAKDTDVDPEALYEHGHQQPRLLGSSPGFGGPYWRYTIPGHGQFRWSDGLRVLADAGYAGAISIELEDVNFLGSVEAEQRGYELSRTYLEGC